MRTLFLIIITMCPLLLKADVVVRTSEQLRQALSRDENLGVISLDGDVFQIDNIRVRAGGTIKPANGRRPLFVSPSSKARQTGKKQFSVSDYNGEDFIVTDGKSYNLPVSQISFMQPYNNLEVTDKTKRTIRIRLTSDAPRNIRTTNSFDLSNTTLKLAYWFVSMDVKNLMFHGNYLYGTVTDSYCLDVLSSKIMNRDITLTFFNTPFGKESYIDKNNTLHLPFDLATAEVHKLCNGLQLCGSRRLSIEGIRFMGFDKAITIEQNKGRNKTINSCSFSYCNAGIHCDNGISNIPTNINVANSQFQNMFGSICVMLYGCDNSQIINNTTENTGLLNKRYEVFSVAGNNFLVKGNTVKNSSYIGIRVGNTREYGKIKIAGVVENNTIDNTDRMNRPDLCLTDGGGIYLFTHNDKTVVRNNTIRNMGFANGDVSGIFLDDGAYNCTVEGNRIENIVGSYSIDSRLCAEYEHHNGGNVFRNNTCTEKARIYGHTKKAMPQTIIEDNDFAAGLMTDSKFVREKNNKVSQ